MLGHSDLALELLLAQVGFYEKSRNKIRCDCYIIPRFNPISHKVRRLLQTVDLVKGKTQAQLDEIPLDERIWHKEEAKEVAFFLLGMPVLNALLIISLIVPFGYIAYFGVTKLLVWIF